MNEEHRTRDTELVLAPNEFAFASDQTKGLVECYVGPVKTSLSQTDQPVIFDYRSKRFKPCTLDQAKQTFITAPEGWYVILKNPAMNKDFPIAGKSNPLIDLDVGKKENISGPVSFALWPGQMAKVVKGHHLRSNQYLVVRVYDDVAAKENWTQAIIKPQSKGSSEVTITDPKASFTMGELLIMFLSLCPQSAWK